MTITLPSGRKIGPGHDVFVVCEIGSNWKTLDDCLFSIRMAKKVGADAVKFQLFTQKELYGRSLYDGKLEYPPGLPWEEIPMQGQLDFKWLPKLKEHADRNSIEFMCTAFSPEGALIVDQYVNIHKVASSDLTYVELLKKLNTFKKPVFVSTGAGSPVEVSLAVHEALTDCDVVPMYCVPNYPARTVNLTQMELLAAQTNMPCGYSDHSLDVLNVPRKAVMRGAVVIEKHANFAGHMDTPDAPHSIDDIQFENMVGAIRFDHHWTDPRENRDMILRHKRRLIATRDLKEGDTLVYGENYGAYRSLKEDSHGWSPWQTHLIEGKVLLKPIKVGDGIGPGDV